VDFIIRIQPCWNESTRCGATRESDGVVEIIQCRRSNTPLLQYSITPPPHVGGYGRRLRSAATVGG
jgi:hypothetical protein